MGDATTATTITDLSPDQVDAVLRDPYVPDDVRATVAANYNVTRYLESVEFFDAQDGFLETRPRSVDGTAEEVPADAPAQTPAEVTPDVAVPPAPASDVAPPPEAV